MRFIPAGAGNTGKLGVDAIRLSVYPRWRGEHPVGVSVIMLLGGLSPLARGTLEKLIKEAVNQRFIPAGAGNTLNIYICFLLQFSESNNLPTYVLQFLFIKELITY